MARFGSLGIYLPILGAKSSIFTCPPSSEVANGRAEVIVCDVLFESMDAEERCIMTGEYFRLVWALGVLLRIKTPGHVSFSSGWLSRRAGIFFRITVDNPGYSTRSTVANAQRIQLATPSAGRANQDLGLLFAMTKVPKRHILYRLKRFTNLPVRDLSRRLVSRPFWKAVRTIAQGLMCLGRSKFCRKRWGGGVVSKV